MLVRLLQKLLKLFVNLVFLAQIMLSVTVFVVTVYWFMDIFGLRYFDFAKPIADFASALVGIFVPRGAAWAGLYGIELNLLYFDIAALLCVYLGDKLKIKIYIDMEKLDGVHDKRKLQAQYHFNDKLREDFGKILNETKNVAVLVEFGLKLAYTDLYYQDNLSDKLHEYEQYALNEFYKSISKTYACEKRGSKVFIVSEFVNANKLLTDIQKIIHDISIMLGEKQWILDKYISVEGYNQLTPEVYTRLEGLLNLQLVDKIVGYSTFVRRYELEPERLFNIDIVGTYAQEVWELQAEPVQNKDLRQNV